METNTELKMIHLSEVESQQIKWLWYPFIPYGKLSIVQGDPGDEVLLHHGMGDRADADGDMAAIHSDDRHMLFGRAVAGTRDKLGHLLTAAYDGHALVLHECDDVAAVVTAVEFLIHGIPSCLVEK